MSSKGLKSSKRKGSESSEKFDALKSKKPKLFSGEQHGKPKSVGDKEKNLDLSKKERRVKAKVNIWI